MLSISELNVSYNGIHALKGISLNVPEGKIVALVGANGAGKSTLLRTISGLVPSSSGSIKFLDQEIARMPAHRIAREGLALVPEGSKVFAELSIYENLLMGAFARKDKEQIKKDVDWVYGIFPQAQGAFVTNSRNPLGGRAADAGRRPRPDEPPETDPPR